MTSTLDAPGSVEAPHGAPAGLGDTPLLRINPVAGRRLGAPELRTALRALVAATRAKAGLRDAAADELFAIAGTISGPERSRVLVLKRAIYNDRTPEEWVHDREWPEAVAAWLAEHQKSELARAAVRHGHAGHLAAERTLLAELIGSEPFQLALALNSPQVLDAVRRYRRSPGAPTARDRKSERGIVQHLARAFVRTSPLSRFTALALGEWDDAGVPLDQVRYDATTAQPFVSLDRALLTELVTGIVADGLGTSPTVLTRNRTLRSNPGGVRFQATGPDGPRLLTAPPTPQLQALLDLTAAGPMPAGVLAQHVATRLGIPVEAGAGVVAAAARAQLLVAGPALDEQAPDPLPEARAVLAVEHPELADVVAGIEKDLRVIATGTVGDRLSALGRLEVVGEPQLNGASARPSRLHVNEDLVLPPVRVSTAGYDPALADLAHVTEYLHLFDRQHEVRALLTTAFIDRFGVGGQARLVDVAGDLIAMVLRREAGLNPSTAADFGPADGSLARLCAVRSAATIQLVDRLLAADGAPELTLDPRWLAGLAADLPDRFRATPASYALLAQPVDGDLVVNECYPGRGLLSMRFVGPDAALGGSAGERITRRVAGTFGDGRRRVLEDRGLHGANINHRAGLFDDTIDGAGWAQLRLVHDPASDTLEILDADGAPVAPVTLGMKWIEVMPPPIRLAMWLLDSGRVMVDPLDDAHRRSPGSALPRLRAGRVVLRRRRWYAGSDLPLAAEPGREAEYLLAVTAWRARHDVPDQIVAKTPVGGTLARDVTDGIGTYLQGRKREKPQYVDLASALMVRTLPRLLERRGTGYLEEALPTVRNGVHAREWALELDRPGHGTFTADLRGAEDGAE